ncbi:MAG: hypothetical protein RLZZ230_246 [Candidatus Parcubacteria bacterium]|jgi:hypothetical protein
MNYFKKHLSIILLTGFFFIGSASFAHASVSTAIQDILWAIVNGVFGRILAISGLLLDVGINQFVIGFGDNFLDSGVGVAVDTLWQGVRDFFNLTFIFGLVYIGFKMILNSDDSGTRRWLIHLIMAALLVNFSLYITKFIVDLSNITATQIVINGFPQVPGVNSDISLYFMNNIGLQTSWGEEIPGEIQRSEAGGSIWGYIFGTAMIFIVASFVFAVGGIMLIIRYAVLALFMVLSPLMFIGWVFPSMQSYTDAYWKKFLGKAFYAPVYVLLIYFAAKVIDAFYNQGSVAGGKISFANAFISGGDAGVKSIQTTLPPFILACIFLVAAVVVGQKMGADGASSAMSFGKNLTGRARRYATNSTRFVASQTAGRAARATSTAAGGALERRFNHLQASDTRAGWAARTTGADRVIRGATGAMQGAKFGLSTTVEQDTTHAANINNRFENAQALKHGRDAEINHAAGNIIDPATGKVVSLSSLSGPALDAAEQARETAIAKAQTTINDLSQKQLEEMFVGDRAMFDSVVGKLKGGQFDKLMDSDKINSGDKSKISDARTNSIKKTYVENGKIISENLQRLSIKQIETLGDSFIRENSHLFSESQMEAVKKSDSFTEGQKGSYVAGRKSNIIKAARSTDPEERKRLFNHNSKSTPDVYSKVKKAAEIASLPLEVFIYPTDPTNPSGPQTVDTENIKKIDKDVLAAILVANKDITLIQRRELASAIRNPANGANTTDMIDYLNSSQGLRKWS